MPRSDNIQRIPPGKGNPIKKPSGEMVFNPGPDTVLGKEDVLIALGDREQMRRLRRALV